MEIRFQEPMLLRVCRDIVFKAVFGREDEECKQVLMDLLNSILELKGTDRIQDLTYKNPFNLQEFPSEKLTIMDIKVQTVTGHWIDIELQAKSDHAFRNRSLYYWSELYSDSFASKMPFNTLKKCIVINILSDDCIHETQKYHTKFGIYEEKEKFLLTDHLEIHYVELSKLDQKPVAEMTDMEQWMTWLRYSDYPEKETIIYEILERKEKIRMANEILKKISADEVIREQIRAYEMAEHDQATREYFAREEGEERKAIEIAKAILLEGGSPEFVAKTTKLSEETIKKLMEDTH